MPVRELKKTTVECLHYFAKFQYAPTFEILHRFLGTKISKKDFKAFLDTQVSRKNILLKNRMYTLPQYILYLEKTLKKFAISQQKKPKVQRYVSLIEKLGGVQLVGISGSLSMDNANWNDDLDLFIVTKRGRIWTTRLLCILIAEILRVRRQRREAHTQDKVCLNLFMDGSQMKVPTFKQSQYTAHEVLQMKPLVSKNSTYELFLKENSWVFTIFPNAQKELRFNKEVRAKSQRHSSTKPVKRSVIAISSEKIGDMIELCCRMIQLSLIRRHQTTEIITDTQLWFFPDDYEKKLTPID